MTVRELPGRVFQGTVTPHRGRDRPDVAHAAHRGAGAEPGRPACSPVATSPSASRFSGPIPRLLIPGTALLVDARACAWRSSQPDGTLHYRPIQIGRDFGAQMEVLAGLEPSDVIATNLPGGLTEGHASDRRSPPSSPSPTVEQARPTPAGDAGVNAAGTRDVP